jgi:hypothetical protein
MRKIAMFTAALALVGVAAAQNANPPQSNPPSSHISKYVWVETSQVNNAKADAYNRVARQYREAAARTSPDVRWLAARSITGDSNEVTYITFADSLAAIDRTLKAFDDMQRDLTVRNASFATEAAESERGSSAELAKYRDDISYNPEAIDGPQVTRWRVTTFRLKPGYASDFEELEKQVIELHRKAQDNAHWIAYQIIGGAEGPAFVMVTPLRSLADLDQEDTPAAKEVFSPIVKHQLSSIVKEAVRSISTKFLAADPSLSRPPETYIAANPDFWNPKEETTTASARSSRKSRKSATEPAGQRKEENPR